MTRREENPDRIFVASYFSRRRLLCDSPVRANRLRRDFFHSFFLMVDGVITANWVQIARLGWSAGRPARRTAPKLIAYGYILERRYLEAISRRSLNFSILLFQETQGLLISNYVVEYRESGKVQVSFRARRTYKICIWQMHLRDMFRRALLRARCTLLFCDKITE